MKKKVDNNIEIKEEPKNDELLNELKEIKEGLLYIVKYIKDYKVL